ncbi:NAD(P)H dehydrogenase [Massilia sp. Dwa41.01b]|uniref:glutathione-regulated potassium-efflux system oxidoreductase KefF n=1 Tax=unclassified Massilia TaxID=2609279 RepID=UPI0016036BF4|nr:MULTISPECIES: NAD(P)H-dependent oxidoreductase [unclassified Massilia]QNA89153.1 NAD(P)H dehydrogenase [Massilia sp. Dwa41.01b]QNB00046.1 NAD(P)H dehydrogenase [Massilia sp. Se16.2.3]
MATAPRILVIYAHPAPHRSRINRRLATAAAALDGVLVHDLYETYPDFFIDVAREQALLEAAELVVFLHPIRWYSMPSLLKEWVDSVLLPGWAYGPGAAALRGKVYWLAVTTGSPEASYGPGERHGRPFADFLPPFEQTALLCGMTWWPPHILHGTNSTDDQAIDAHVAAFRDRLQAFLRTPRTGAAHGT